MKQRLNSSARATTAFLYIIFVWASAFAARADQPVKAVIIPSNFVLPTNPKEGRDPFFPASTRPYQSTTVAVPHATDVTSLVLRGMSGPPDHRLVIINNHTFGVGDEGDVITSDGRIHIHCVEIKDRFVIIETGGERHQLPYPVNQ